WVVEPRGGHAVDGHPAEAEELLDAGPRRWGEGGEQPRQERPFVGRRQWGHRVTFPGGRRSPFRPAWTGTGNGPSGSWRPGRRSARRFVGAPPTSPGGPRLRRCCWP